MGDFKFIRGYKDESQIEQPTNRQVLPTNLAYEPMRVNRFFVIFPESFNISPYFIRSTRRPSLSFNRNGNAHSWDDIEFNLIDAIEPSSSRRIFELINSDEIYSPIVVKLQMLDPVGTVVSDWSIWGRITSVDFGNLDYSNDDLAEIKMTMSISNAILNY